jgi:transcription elongation factor Elf1
MPAPRRVWRTIAKKGERQGSGIFDVLVCGHAVLVDDATRANTYRRARACPECAARVAAHVAERVREA